MRIIIKKILFLFATFCLLFSSCVKEELGVEGVFVEGEAVVLSVNATAAAAAAVTDEGDAEDRALSSLRILIYDYVGGALQYNILCTSVPTVGNPARLDIRTGTYAFLLRMRVPMLR